MLKPKRIQPAASKPSVVKKKSNPLVGLTLPKFRRKPDSNILNYISMFYGRGGVGKTSILGTFPDMLMLSTERVSRGLSYYDFNTENGGNGVTSWDILVKALDLLERGGHDFKTVGIDTLDAAYQHCMEWCCLQLGVKHISDAAYGKGWNLLRTEFRETLLRVPRMGLGLIVTSHSKESTIKAPSGAEVSRIEPSCSGQAYDVIKSISDVTIYVDWMKNLITGENMRVMITNGDEVLDAKNSLGLPRYIAFDKANGFDQIVKAHTGEYKGVSPSHLIPSEKAAKAAQQLATMTRQVKPKKSVKKKAS